MQIIVASGNIFRRELSSYVLGEQGYNVAEVKYLDALLAQIAALAPALLIVDPQFSPSGQLDLLRRVRTQSLAPILWIGGGTLPPYDLPASLQGRAGSLAWPYNPADLLRCVAELLEPMTPLLIPSDQPAQRYLSRSE